MQKPNIYHANTCPPCPPTATAFEKCVYWLGIGLGSGLPKKAPGTWGTLGGLMIALPMMYLGLWGFLAITILGCLVGSYICGKTSDLMGVHDDPHIVFDEWVGMWIALLPVVFFNVSENIYYVSKTMQAVNKTAFALMILASFALFRFFDIIKPFPIKWVDNNVSGGFGILIDDVLAGLMAMAVMVLVIFVTLMVIW